MDSTSRYFIALINAFLKETTPPKPNYIDWYKIYDLASIHSLSGAVYIVVQRLENSDKPELAILNKFKSDFFNTTLRYEEQEKAYHEIIRKLKEEKLEHILFKGIVVREYYPVKQMRTLGDMDFLFHKKDYRAVNEAFYQIGYKNIAKEKGHEEKYKKGNIFIEAHYNILYSKINSKIDYISYFENAWDNATAKENGYTYELNMEYHFVFLLTHIAKHFYASGAGVRMILDIAAIINKFGDTLNFSYIWKELTEIKLDVFAQNIFGLCDKWFQVSTPDTTFDMEDSTFKNMAEYILDGGTFGLDNQNRATHFIRKEYQKTDNLKVAQLRAFGGRIFLNFEDMSHQYPSLTRLPLLLPFFWVRRGLRCIIKKRSRTINLLKGIYMCSNEAKQSHELRKKIGL